MRDICSSEQMGLVEFILVSALFIFLFTVTLLVALGLLGAAGEWIVRRGRVDLHFTASGSSQSGEEFLQRRQPREDFRCGEYETPISVGHLSYKQFVCCVTWF